MNRPILFIKSIIYYAILLLVVSACDHDEASTLASYLHEEENGLSIQQVTDNMVLRAHYIPWEFQALKDGEQDLSKYEEHIYMKFSLQSATKNRAIQELLTEKFGRSADQKWQELLLSTQSNFSIKYGDQIFPCVIHHGMPPAFENQALDFWLVFKAPGLVSNQAFTQTLELVFEDNILTDHTHQFSFGAEHLNAIPLPSL